MGSPVSQNRQGRSAALLTPTRGPRLTRGNVPAEWLAGGGRGRRIRSGEPGSHASAPSWARSMPRAWHSRAGPRARSRSSHGRPGPAREPPRGREAAPSVTRPARSSTAEEVPSGRQTRLTQKCMP